MYNQNAVLPRQAHGARFGGSAGFLSPATQRIGRQCKSSVVYTIPSQQEMNLYNHIHLFFAVGKRYIPYQKKFQKE